mgnify:CR=1 FL=1
MRLFLSSENLGDYQDEFLSLLDGVRLAYIANAKDDLSEQDREAKVLEHKDQFESLGLSFTEIDLKMFFQEKIPEDILDEFDVVWCSGGNTFVLRAAMEKSGFDSVLVDAVKEGIVAYGGSSAGAVIAGPSLHGVEYGDNPDLVVDIYGSEVNWDGLHLVDFVTVPHIGSEWFDNESQNMVEQLKRNKTPYEALSDGQVVIVDGDKKEVLQ